MERTLGGRIASLRRQRGMTQEALALTLGISAGAVSKWETGASCPDIALLCPIARALGTNVDTLLAFEQELSGEQVVREVERVISIARGGDLPGAMAALDRLLHAYPSCAALQYNAAHVMDVFFMMQPQAEEAQRQAWRAQKRALLERLHGAGHAYSPSAAAGLAAMALEDGDLARAQALLGEEQQPDVDTHMLRVRLYQKRGEHERALETLQKRLFVLLGRAQVCLTQMMGESITPDAGKRLAIARAACALDEQFGVNAGFTVGLLFEQCLSAGDKDGALSALARYVQVMVSPAAPPNPLLFSPTFRPKPDRPAAMRELRQILLDGLLSEESCAPLRGEPAYEEAVRRLRESLAHEAGEQVSPFPV